MAIVKPHIDSYKAKVYAMSSDELALCSLNSAGVYIGGECVIHNALITGRLRGLVPDDATLEHTALNTLIAGIDTSAATMTAALTLIAKEQVLSNGRLPT